MAYVEAGPADVAETLLLLHGEPMWGYLYRTMISTFVAAGFRLIVPDLIGFGRSDKPADPEAVRPQLLFPQWRLFAQEANELIPSKIVRGWRRATVPQESLSAYDVPFPTQEFAAGARRFPMLVPITIDDPERIKGDAAQELLGAFTKPVLTLWGERCPFTSVRGRPTISCQDSRGAGKRH